MPRSRRVPLAATFLVGLLGVTAAAAPVASAEPGKCVVVNRASNARSSTLQAAVDAASPGDSLRVAGTCVGTTTITKDLTIEGKKGNGARQAILDGNHAGSVLTINGGTVTLERLLITRGTASDSLWGDRGGGINLFRSGPGLPARAVILIDSSVSGNTATDGGGISVEDSTLTLIDSTVSGNIAVRGGGISTFSGGDVDIKGSSSVSDNRATSDGGGVYHGDHSRLALNDTSSVDHNTAGNDAGGIYTNDSSSEGVDLNDTSSVHHNTAGGNGGGVGGESVLLRLNGSASIHDNVAGGNGGGVGARSRVFGSVVSLSGTSSVRDNTAAGTGGGVFLDGPAFVGLNDGSAIVGNRPDNCYPAGRVAGCTG